MTQHPEVFAVFGQIANRSFRYVERQLNLLIVAAVVLYPAGYLLERLFTTPTFDSLLIRISCVMLVLPLLAHSRHDHWFHQYLPQYWMCLLAIIFPLSFGLILVLNAANTPIDSDLSIMWVAQYLVALFLFVQLAMSTLAALVLWLLSAVLCAVAVLAIDTPNWSQIETNVIDLTGVFLTAIFTGSITNRNIEAIQAEKVRAASAIGSNLAHELRTPLATIRNTASAVGRYLDDLVEGYVGPPQDFDSQRRPLTHEQIGRLSNSLLAIQQEVDYSNTVIDMLLVSTTERPLSTHGNELVLASQLIQDAVARFPFNNSHERSLVSTDIECDFWLCAPRLLLTHVVFNLMKNALYHVQRGGKGRITVSTNRTKNRNLIRVRDSGPGIPKTVQRRMFDRFYSTRDDGTGIGLSFCRMVMKELGGSIEFRGKEGDYSQFDLQFPASKEPQPSKPLHSPE